MDKVNVHVYTNIQGLPCAHPRSQAQSTTDCWTNPGQRPRKDEQGGPRQHPVVHDLCAALRLITNDVDKHVCTNKGRKITMYTT